ncbi:tetratricopeptide repeat protein [Noviherbaspirillum aerium]|uniref:tetratricopeptide repeat protein n=1 Tax=Noviherbaspirillum aerium TaxID=2588497 RepID=UPI00124CE962|nr:hypothetical protein [Noviherbaspirillum aerium]
MKRICHLAALLAFLSCAGQGSAAPYVPDNDGKVLERLPFKANDPVARELGSLRATLKRNPDNVQVATRLADRYYRLVSEEGDPRYLGYAQAALGPWWNMQSPPEDVQILRASLRQYRHDFSGAVSDLDQVLSRNPGNARALALRAIIHIVQARYVQGIEDCQSLRKAGDPLIGLGCVAMVEGLTGKAVSAYAALNKEVSAATSVSPENRLWLEIRLAELAERQSLPDVAETHFKKAIALGINDTFLLAAYADLLLEQRRAAEVVNLLKDRQQSDVLLLRLVFAERELQMPSAKERADLLGARYAAAQMRGETVHQQEEARFALAVQNDPRRALMLAQENWKVQREPRDAEIYLKSAIAMKDAASAQPVLEWLEESRIEDRKLASLARQLRSIR